MPSGKTILTVVLVQAAVLMLYHSVNAVRDAFGPPVAVPK